MFQGHPVVTDYGSTFGTAFIPSVREKVAKLRKEVPPLATVSLVATYGQTLSWIDHSQLHPHIRQKIATHTLRFFEHLAFLRLPANARAISELGENYINPFGEFQSFIVSDSDPLLSALISLGHPPYYAVRSSNITGEPEEYTIPGALKFAAKIRSPYLAVTNADKKDSRKRLGSQPILHFPQKPDSPEVILARMGSTHPEALEIIVKYLFPQAIFTLAEEKKVDYRKQYHPKDDGFSLDPEVIRQALLTAAGL